LIGNGGDASSTDRRVKPRRGSRAAQGKKFREPEEKHWAAGQMNASQTTLRNLKEGLRKETYQKIVSREKMGGRRTGAI